MFCFEMYCPVCGCAFSLPDIRDPVNPDPNENPTLELGDPYDSRLLPEDQIQVRRCSSNHDVCSMDKADEVLSGFGSFAS